MVHRILLTLFLLGGCAVEAGDSDDTTEVEASQLEAATAAASRSRCVIQKPRVFLHDSSSSVCFSSAPSRCLAWFGSNAWVDYVSYYASHTQCTIGCSVQQCAPGCPC